MAPMSGVLFSMNSFGPGGWEIVLQLFRTFFLLRIVITP